MPPGLRRWTTNHSAPPPPPPPYMPPGRRRRDDEPERSSPPRMPRQRDRRDQRYNWSPYLLPDGQTILAYKDRQGVLLTDHGGSTRPVADVCREVEILSHLSRDPAPPDADDSDSKRPDKDQQTPTPNPRPSPAQYTEEDQQTATPIPGTSQAQYAEEDQPAPQQTPTPNPGPSPAQYVEDLLNKAFAVHKLEMAQRRKELLDTRTLEESSDASSPSLPQSPSREDREPSVLLVKEFRDANSSSMPQSPSREDREINVLKELPDTTTLDKSCITSVSPSLLQSLLSEVQDNLALKLHRALMSSSFVSSLVPTGLFIKYFVRVDKGGFFHTYPDRGGPFQTLEKAQEAIDSHHVVQRKMMCMDGLSDEERAVRNTLYWYHDGTRKHSAEAFASCTTRSPTRELLKALLDRHNEDNDLLGDRAYELKDIVRHNSCFDGKDCIYRSYDHFNLTMKTKEADANKDLYFAEVTCMSGDYEAYVLTCICEVKPHHNGECLVCEVKMKDMKHPTEDVYNKGRRSKLRVISSHRSDACGVALFEKLFAVRDEAWLIEEEARVRQMIKEGKEARRIKLEVDRGDGMIKEGKDARRNKLVVDNIRKWASRRLEMDNIPKWARRSNLEVDNRGDSMIKEGKEARRSKLEVDNRGDDHGKRDKYVVPARRVERDQSRDCI